MKKDISIKMIFSDDQQEKELDSPELDLLGHKVRNTLFSLFKFSIKKRDLMLLSIYIEFVLRAYLLKQKNGQAFALMDRFHNELIGFEPNHVHVEAHGKKATIDFSEVKTPTFINLKIIKSIFSDGQYLMDYDFKNKVVIDGGANIGAFSICSVLLGAKKVFAFEPVESTFLQLRKNIRANGLENIVIPINKAIGSENLKSEVLYRFKGDPGAHLITAQSPLEIKNGQSQITEIVKLDDVFEEKKIDFIKLDIEGNEKEALLGATNLIKKNRPKIVMAAYHNKDGMTLPKVLNKITAGYICKLICTDENDFYCTHKSLKTK